MDYSTLRKLCKDYDPVISEIMDTMSKHRVKPEIGEQILLMLAGMSAGSRQASLFEDWIKPASMGWNIAVEDGNRHPN